MARQLNVRKKAEVHSDSQGIITPADWVMYGSSAWKVLEIVSVLIVKYSDQVGMEMPCGHRGSRGPYESEEGKKTL